MSIRSRMDEAREAASGPSSVDVVAICAGDTKVMQQELVEFKKKNTLNKILCALYASSFQFMDQFDGIHH